MNDGLANSDTATSTIHVVDATAPIVTSVVVNDTQMTDADTGLTRIATITFSEAMDQTGTPTITNNAGTTLTSPTNAHWVDATHYAVSYTAADAGVSQSNITFNVSGAKDLAGNTQVAASNVSSGTSIDTQNPTLAANIIATSLSDGTPSSTVNFVFSEAVTGFASATSPQPMAPSAALRLPRLVALQRDVYGDRRRRGNRLRIGCRGTYIDLAGNSGGTGSDTVTIDRANPMITSITGSSSRSGNVGTATFTVTF